MMTFLAATLLSVGILTGGFFYLKKLLFQSVGAETEEKKGELEVLDEELRGYEQYLDSYGSKGQFDGVVAQLEDIRKLVDAEKQKLRELEGKLDGSQEQVEGKEASQQEMKAARDADESLLSDLLDSYEAISSQSMSLEQELAQDLKNIDSMCNELEATEEQKAILEQVQDTLTNASALLRDLLTEYEATNERLSLLHEQHEDLEDEYTRLVEQQLGS